MAGGSLSQAFKSGLIGALQGAAAAGIGQGFKAYMEAGLWEEICRAAAHGVNAGVFADVQGGDFSSAFYAGAFSTAVTHMSGLNSEALIGKENMFCDAMIAGIVGGTASEIGGGKFENGAMSGAFQYLLNNALTPEDNPKELIAPDKYVKENRPILLGNDMNEIDVQKFLNDTRNANNLLEQRGADYRFSLFQAGKDELVTFAFLNEGVQGSSLLYVDHGHSIGRMYFGETRTDANGTSLRDISCKKA